LEGYGTFEISGKKKTGITNTEPAECCGGGIGFIECQHAAKEQRDAADGGQHRSEGEETTQGGGSEFSVVEILRLEWLPE
jgi:hypothetical protein